MKKKICLIFNQASHYREAIYCAIDNEYDCDWYFSDCRDGIKQMDLSLLKNTYHYKTYNFHNALYWEKGILKLLFKKEYQVFLKLGESRSLTGYIFNFIAHILGKKVYLWSHGWYGKEKGINAIIKLQLFKNVTGIFTYGDYAKKLLVERGIPAEKIFPIHNSLDYDKQKALRENMVLNNIYKDYFGNSFPTIIFIGRLTKVKKLDLLIKAIAKLRDNKCEYYNIVFVGDGTEKKMLNKEIEFHMLEKNVWFYGSCYDDSKNAELLYNADLCVSPGNIGLTAIHSMMFGCPCISHNDFSWQMPEFEAIKEGLTGDFFEIDNVESLSEVISNWFKQNFSKRDDVRIACFNEIDKYWNPNYQMNVIKRIFDSL